MQLPLRTKRFDEAQVLVQGPDCDGRRALLAVCTGPNAQHHADAIVLAVNAHEDLLAACKAFMAKWRRQGMGANLQLEKFDQIARQMEAAIAKAEGRAE